MNLYAIKNQSIKLSPISMMENIGGVCESEKSET